MTGFANRVICRNVASAASSDCSAARLANNRSTASTSPAYRTNAGTNPASTRIPEPVIASTATRKITRPRFDNSAGGWIAADVDPACFVASRCRSCAFRRRCWRSLNDAAWRPNGPRSPKQHLAFQKRVRARARGHARFPDDHHKCQSPPSGVGCPVMPDPLLRGPSPPESTR